MTTFLKILWAASAFCVAIGALFFVAGALAATAAIALAVLPCCFSYAAGELFK